MAGPSHVYYCGLSEIEIEKAWDLDSGPDFDFDSDPDTDLDFDETINMRLPWLPYERLLQFSIFSYKKNVIQFMVLLTTNFQYALCPRCSRT